MPAIVDASRVGALALACSCWLFAPNKLLCLILLHLGVRCLSKSRSRIRWLWTRPGFCYCTARLVWLPWMMCKITLLMYAYLFVLCWALDPSSAVSQCTRGDRAMSDESRSAPVTPPRRPGHPGPYGPMTPAGKSGKPGQLTAKVCTWSPVIVC